MALQPYDFTQYYLSASMGLGQHLRLDTIDSRLAGYPVRRVLGLLAQFAFRADQAIGDERKQVQLARQLFPTTAVDRAVSLLESDPAATSVSSRVVLNLALRALVHCPDDDSAFEGEDADLARGLGGLILALADHAAGGGNDELLELELVRLDLFFRLHDLSAWYEVAYLLLFETLPSLEADPDFLNSDAVVRDAYELDLELFWVLTVAYGISSGQDPQGFVLPRAFAGGVVTDQEIDRWSRAWFIELDESILKARADLDTGSWWVFTAFFDRPVIRLNANGVVIRPAILANKASPVGMFWAIRDPFVGSGGDHEQWARLFGRAVEKLGRRLLAEHVQDAPRLENEDEIRRRWGEGRACDVVVLGDVWIAIDFVYRQLTLATTALGDFDDLLVDLRRAAVDKLLQIDDTLQRGLGFEDVEPNLMIPVVVTGAPFPVKPPLLSRIEQLVAEGGAEVIGVHENCLKPVVLDMAELLLILNSASYFGRSLASLIQDWQSSSLGGDTFRNWFVTYGPGPDMVDAGALPSTWQETVQRRLYDRGE